MSAGEDGTVNGIRVVNGLCSRRSRVRQTRAATGDYFAKPSRVKSFAVNVGFSITSRKW